METDPATGEVLATVERQIEQDAELDETRRQQLLEFFRAVPVLLMMVFAYFGYFATSNLVPNVHAPLAAVVTALTLYNGAVIAELVRSGVRSLPKGQREAAAAVGMTSTQSLRLVEVPQALIAMLPSLLSQFVVILKDSALGYLIGFFELLQYARQLGSGQGNILQTLFVALLVGFALQAMGESGRPVLKAVTYIQAVVFRLLMMVMWLAPLGAFGAIAAVVGATGVQAITSMLVLMLAFYITCALFIIVILGLMLKIVTGVNIFSLMKYLAREYLLIFSTSSSEAALPRLIAKMEHLGVSKPVVGVVVPTGYSFNLDGTAIYLTMGALFVADAMGTPLALGEQITLLLFMIIASKGAAGVSGAGIATLAAGLQSHRPDLVDGVGLIVGIDRFMSEARALTNFSGNAVATLVLGTWVREIDRDRVSQVLSGKLPFDEAQMAVDPHASPTAPEQALEGHEQSKLA